MLDEFEVLGELEATVRVIVVLEALAVERLLAVGLSDSGAVENEDGELEKRTSDDKDKVRGYVVVFSAAEENAAVDTEIVLDISVMLLENDGLSRELVVDVLVSVNDGIDEVGVPESSFVALGLVAVSPADEGAEVKLGSIVNEFANPLMLLSKVSRESEAISVVFEMEGNSEVFGLVTL
ncbi:MAG: hypothetical protein Q9227_006164 [Pyrenula ochraceoflavens]